MKTQNPGRKCQNCGLPVIGHPENGCIIATLIQTVRDRGNLSEEQIVELHANLDVDGIWGDIGKIVDQIEMGYYTFDGGELAPLVLIPDFASDVPGQSGPVAVGTGAVGVTVVYKAASGLLAQLHSIGDETLASIRERLTPDDAMWASAYAVLEDYPLVYPQDLEAFKNLRSIAFVRFHDNSCGAVVIWPDGPETVSVLRWSDQNGKLALLIADLAETSATTLEDVREALVGSAEEYAALVASWYDESGLVDEYERWCKKEGVPHVSADEHDLESLTSEQRNYIGHFQFRWEAVMEAQRAQRSLGGNTEPAGEIAEHTDR